jgi:hypothetical protein
LEKEYPISSTPITIKVKGVGSELLTVFKVNGKPATIKDGSPNFTPDKKGVYEVSASSDENGTLIIYKFITAQ